MSIRSITAITAKVIIIMKIRGSLSSSFGLFVIMPQANLAPAFPVDLLPSSSISPAKKILKINSTFLETIF